MSGLLTDTVAVVTGGASGNGRAIARVYADHGADVVVADVQREPREGGTPTHELIAEETSQRARFVECDVSERSDHEDAMDAAEALGGIDVMINNAGILIMTPITEMTEAEYDRLMDVNLKGVFFGCQAAADRMLASDGGNIINISSTAGMIGGAENSLYCASKGGVRLLTYALAAELGPTVRVNAIHPATTDTQMVTEDVEIMGTDEEQRQAEQLPLKRLGRPEDIANAAVYLGSDLADFVTGESLLVDGGGIHT